jgi:methyl-accepting chemotaxis protein
MSKEQALGERLKFVGLDGPALATLRGMKKKLMPALPTALDAFYEKIESTPETRKFFSSAAMVQGAKGRQRDHWDMISDGDFGSAYLAAVTKVGEIHARIGLEPRWYIGGYALILEHLIDAVLAARWPKGGLLARKTSSKATADELDVLVKAALVDMDLAISVYLEALDTARRKTEAHAQAANQAVVSAIGEALTALAAGRLTHRIGDVLPPEYAALRSDFNTAMEKLQEAMRSISSNARGVRSGAGEITAASDDLSRRTEQQAASLEQTAAALAEITNTVRKTSETANDARKLVADTAANAERSGAVAAETVAAMNGIESSSKQISNIIGVIDEIAFQTNLLALNAGVEAARAGDAGRGFAVVATEVRALAQRCADAAKEIKVLISASGKQVDTGVTLVAETGKALARIVEQVGELNGLIGRIAASAHEQATGLAEVNTAVNQMDQVTQQNAAMVEQATAASHSLTGEADELARMVGQFSTGDAAEAPVPKAAAAPIRRPPPVPPAGAARRPRIPVDAPVRLPADKVVAFARTDRAAPAAAAEEKWDEF